MCVLFVIQKIGEDTLKTLPKLVKYSIRDAVKVRKQKRLHLL